MLKLIPDCYKKRKMFNKAVDNYAHALEFVRDCYKTQRISNKAIDTYPSAYNLFLVNIRLKKCVIKLLMLVLSQQTFVYLQGVLKTSLM